ncbi:MAG: hypothetical protein NZT92_00805 [Abditibacteriales bacterium]|nr:hypothetical protein [Abditibacteriales bacterium]MDW8364933.1 hypothetical protein [Abditibacteriales bacterium]
MPTSHNGWLRAVLDSPAKVELLAFFYLNQYTVDDAAGLSRWLGLDLEKVSIAAEELSQAHILTKIGEGKDAVFTLNRDEKIQEAVENFIKTYYLPLDQRHQILSDLLQGRTIPRD